MGEICSTHGAKINTYRILLGKYEEDSPLGRPECEWQNTNIDLKGTACKFVDWIHVIHDRVPLAGSCEHCNKLLGSIISCVAEKVIIFQEILCSCAGLFVFLFKSRPRYGPFWRFHTNSGMYNTVSLNKLSNEWTLARSETYLSIR
jgi:hypothetical protein